MGATREPSRSPNNNEPHPTARSDVLDNSVVSSSVVSTRLGFGSVLQDLFPTMVELLRPGHPSGKHALGSTTGAEAHNNTSSW